MTGRNGQALGSVVFGNMISMLEDWGSAEPRIAAASAQINSRSFIAGFVCSAVSWTLENLVILTRMIWISRQGVNVSGRNDGKVFWWARVVNNLITSMKVWKGHKLARSVWWEVHIPKYESQKRKGSRLGWRWQHVVPCKAYMNSTSPALTWSPIFAYHKQNNKIPKFRISLRDLSSRLDLNCTKHIATGYFWLGISMSGLWDCCRVTLPFPFPILTWHLHLRMTNCHP